MHHKPFVFPFLDSCEAAMDQARSTISKIVSIVSSFTPKNIKIINFIISLIIIITTPITTLSGI